MRRARLLSFALFVSGVLPGFVLAQGTLADYQRAEEVRERFDVLGVTSDVGRPTWIGQTSHFWYRTSVLGGDEFVWVDAETQEKRPAFDHQRLAKALSAMTDTSYTALTLPFREIEFLNGERALAVSFEGMRYTCDLSSYMCEGEREADRRGGWTWGSFPPEPEAESEPIASPDKRYEAQVRNYNVYVRNAETGEMTPLSTDGNEGNYYAPRTIEWSPDSRRIAAYRVKPGYRRAVHYIESSPEDQLQPKHSTRFYAKPGDVLDLEQPVLFDVERKRQIIIDNALFPNPYGLSALEWWEDGRAFTF
ncbi:MAG: DPP IV N-terminal domain-containing protein, partial [Rhodothermales bacterium]